MVNYIRQLREDRGWSMQKLADRCTPPTTASQVNKLEKEHVKLTQNWMNRIAPAFGCEPAELILEGGASISPDERALLDKYRLVSREGKTAAHSLLDALPQSTAVSEETGTG